MTDLLRAATLVVADAPAAAARYATTFDYRVVEDGVVDASLAASWGAPASSGRRCIVLRPASGCEVDLRLVEGDPVAGYRPLRSFGWAAIEICVQDTDAVHARVRGGPFRVIGPPRAHADLPTIYPMQVRGPDDEIVYLTEIRGDPATTGLPRAAAPIDRLFIVVLACSDLDDTSRWFASRLGVDVSGRTSIVYRMLNDAFDLPAGTRHDIVVGRHGPTLFVELDQYPAAAVPRARHPDALPPGVAVCTLVHPDIARITGPWTTPPTARDGVVYGGREVGVLATPDGALLEIVDGRAR